MIFYRWIFPIILVLGTFAQLADSGTISRPTKTFGGTAFVNGVVPDASDFNGDITTIYSDYNGNISDINIANAAGIAGSKITPTFTTQDVLAQKANVCVGLWDTTQLADARLWKFCNGGGLFTLSAYTDAGVSQLSGFTINRTTGVVTFNTVTTDAPTGEIKMFGGSSAPTGYVFCNGTAISRSTFAALFAVIGTTYGAGDGSTTFNVPDFRSRVPIGVGTGTGGGASGTGLPSGGSGLTAVARGTWKGEESHVLTVPELAAHTHNVYLNSLAGGGIASANVGGVNTDGGLTQSTTSTGSSTAHNIIQPVMGVNFIIKT